MTQDTVLLLHGLARASWSMRRVEQALRRAGYRTLNPGHPTRKLDLAGLVAHTKRYLGDVAPGEEATLHGVGHSLGGVVLRGVLADPPPPWRAGRLVTIGSPHRGARLVAPLLGWRAARAFYGPVLADLRWDSAALRALAVRGPGEVEVGAIAGAGRFRPFVPGSLVNAWLGLEGAETDGTVERASAFGAPWWPSFADTLDVDAGHTFIAARPEVIRQTLHFLRHGRFDHGGGRPGEAASRAAAGGARPPRRTTSQDPDPTDRTRPVRGRRSRCRRARRTSPR